MPVNVHSKISASALSSLVLVVDDEEDIRRALGQLLKQAGYQMVEAASPAEALAQLTRRNIAAALVDMNYERDTTSGEEGLELIAKIVNASSTLPIIAMTAWSNVPLAVEAMRAGAVDFIEKPWNNARVLAVLQSRIQIQETRRVSKALGQAQRLLMAADTGQLVARSEAMRMFLRDWFQVARSDANVLFLGENGTGKSMLAGLLHQKSARRDGPFIKVDVGGLAPSLFESELFGHVRGAFTDARSDRQGRVELADKGTLFLDEIGNIALDQQAKLLRVIEEGAFERVGSSITKQVDVRFVSATNTVLEREVAEGRFRQDLFYRLNPLELRVPALRERLDDIVELAGHFLQEAAHKYQRGSICISNSAKAALMTYRWPGNVRELSHVMERAVLLSTGECIEAEDLRLPVTAAGKDPDKSLAEPKLSGLTLENAEALLLRSALNESKGNIQRAAAKLGITRQSFYRRMERLRLADDDHP